MNKHTHEPSTRKHENDVDGLADITISRRGLLTVGAASATAVAVPQAASAQPASPGAASGPVRRPRCPCR